MALISHGHMEKELFTLLDWLNSELLTELQHWCQIESWLKPCLDFKQTKHD